MVDAYVLMEPLTIQFLDVKYGLGGKAALIGYPVEDGTAGSSFYIYDRRMLCMSSTCQDKEAAWEFLRETLLPKYKDLDAMYYALTNYSKTHTMVGIPINRADYNLLKRANMSRTTQSSVVYRYHKATAEEVKRFDDFVNRVDKIELLDNNIYNIVQEVASAYFAGDKSLDEAVMLIQQRAQLYVNENR